MADLRDAVRLLRSALDALAANAQPAQDKVLRLNVREARGSLALRVQQLSPATTASLVRVIGSAILVCRHQMRAAFRVCAVTANLGTALLPAGHVHPCGSAGS